jgi:hypothetical protein
MPFHSMQYLEIPMDGNRMTSKPSFAVILDKLKPKVKSILTGALLTDSLTSSSKPHSLRLLHFWSPRKLSRV